MTRRALTLHLDLTVPETQRTGVGHTDSWDAEENHPTRTVAGRLGELLLRFHEATWTAARRRGWAA